MICRGNNKNHAFGSPVFWFCNQNNMMALMEDRKCPVLSMFMHKIRGIKIDCTMTCIPKVDPNSVNRWRTCISVNVSIVMAWVKHKISDPWYISIHWSEVNITALCDRAGQYWCVSYENADLVKLRRYIWGDIESTSDRKPEKLLYICTSSRTKSKVKEAWI